MKAIIQTKYGPPDGLQLKEIEKPTPNEDQVLVKIHAASINAADWHKLTADIFLVRLGEGLRKPKDPMIGLDFAGQVEAVGSNVKEFKPGDEVFGARSGAFAEYVCAKNSAMVLKPANLSFEEAAAVPVAALTALQGLRDKGKIQPGQKVLIHGASGGVGTFAVQLAKYFGAEVTAVCSTRNVDTARSLGADHVIDYTKEDFAKNGQRYDLILAANGSRSIFDYRRVLKPGGTWVMAGGSLSQLLQAISLGKLLSMAGNKKMIFFISSLKREDLNFLKELLEVGKIKPVMDRRYPFSETVEAFRYFGEGHTQGKIVITVP